MVDLGLDKIGRACAPSWSTQDVESFEKGLNECKRDFAQIAEDYLPHKGCHQVGDFYYNVWKTKAIPEAKAWYQRRDEVTFSLQSYKLACEGINCIAEAHYYKKQSRMLTDNIKST